MPFNEAGLPGFNVIKDFDAYDERTRHTNADYPERMSEDELKQSAIVMATFAWQAAMADEKNSTKRALTGMSARSDSQPTLSVYFSSLAEVAFLTAVYWLVGSTPEANHAGKGNAWARIGAFRWAAWHFRKYLKYSDDSFGHASLGWCYGNLKLIEAAVQQYRLAYAKNKRLEIACSLACAEVSAGNLGNARFLVSAIAKGRDQLSREFVPVFAELEDELLAAGAGQEELVPDALSLEPSIERDEQPSSTSRRLVRALSRGCLSFVAVAVVLTVPLVLWQSGTPEDVSEVFLGALVGSVVFGVSLLLLHLPLLTLIHVAFDRRLTSISTGAIGAALGLCSFVIVIASVAAVSREPARVSDWIEALRPARSLPVVVPFVAGGIAFAIAFMNDRLHGVPFDVPLAAEPRGPVGAD